MSPWAQGFGASFVGGNPALKQIALTYDDGPNDPHTLQLMEVLEKDGVRATFFSLGAMSIAGPTLYGIFCKPGTPLGITPIRILIWRFLERCRLVFNWKNASALCRTRLARFRACSVRRSVGDVHTHSALRARWDSSQSCGMSRVGTGKFRPPQRLPKPVAAACGEATSSFYMTAATSRRALIVGRRWSQLIC